MECCGIISIKASDAPRTEAVTIPGSGMYFYFLGVEELLPKVCSSFTTPWGIPEAWSEVRLQIVQKYLSYVNVYALRYWLTIVAQDKYIMQSSGLLSCLESCTQTSLVTASSPDFWNFTASCGTSNMISLSLHTRYALPHPLSSTAVYKLPYVFNQLLNFAFNWSYGPLWPSFIN